MGGRSVGSGPGWGHGEHSTVGLSMRDNRGRGQTHHIQMYKEKRESTEWEYTELWAQGEKERMLKWGAGVQHGCGAWGEAALAGHRAHATGCSRKAREKHSQGCCV